MKNNIHKLFLFVAIPIILLITISCSKIPENVVGFAGHGGDDQLETIRPDRYYQLMGGYGGADPTVSANFPRQDAADDLTLNYFPSFGDAFCENNGLIELSRKNANYCKFNTFAKSSPWKTVGKYVLVLLPENKVAINVQSIEVDIGKVIVKKKSNSWTGINIFYNPSPDLNVKEGWVRISYCKLSSKQKSKTCRINLPGDQYRKRFNTVGKLLISRANVPSKNPSSFIKDIRIEGKLVDVVGKDGSCEISGECSYGLTCDYVCEDNGDCSKICLDKLEEGETCELEIYKPCQSPYTCISKLVPEETDVFVYKELSFVDRRCRKKLPKEGPCAYDTHCVSGRCEEGRCQKEASEYELCNHIYGCSWHDLTCRQRTNKKNEFYGDLVCLKKLWNGRICESTFQCEDGLVCRRYYKGDKSGWTSDPKYRCKNPVTKNGPCEDGKNQCEENLKCFEGKCMARGIKQSRENANLCAPTSAEMALKMLNVHSDKDQYVIGEAICEMVPAYQVANPSSNALDCSWPDNFQETYQPILSDYLSDLGLNTENTATSYNSQTGLVPQERFNEMVNHVRLGRPVIIHVQGHYMLIIDYDDSAEMLYLNNPSDGKTRKVSYSDFRDRNNHWYKSNKKSWDGRYLAIWN